MKKRLTALAISAIMTCTCLVSCQKEEEVNLHTYEATVNGDPFKVSYLVGIGEERYFSDEEISAIDKALSDDVADALHIFSENNSDGISELNKPVDAVLNCSEELIDLLEYTYSLTELTKGSFQPVMGAVTELYKNDGDVVNDETLAEALAHTGNHLITIDGTDIRKADREAKVDLDGIVAGTVLSDASAVLSSKNVTYAVLSYNNTVSTFGKLHEEDTLDMAVYLSNNKKEHSGILSFNNNVATVCNSETLVIDGETGKRAESDFDTVVVLSADGVICNAIAPMIYTMSVEEITRLYSEKQLNFEAVMIYENGEFVKTSENIVYEPVVSE